MLYIAERNPSAAASQFAQIETQLRHLTTYPHAGRPGRVEGTRELIVARTPFIVIYTVGDAVELLRLLHGAQQWPAGIS